MPKIRLGNKKLSRILECLRHASQHDDDLCWRDEAKSAWNDLAVAAGLVEPEQRKPVSLVEIAGGEA